MKHFLTIALLLSTIRLFAQPANDDCPGIINLGPAPICPADVIYNNLNATESNIGFDNFPSCWVGNPERDVWFSFVAVDTILDYRVTVTACPDPNGNIDPMVNPQIAIYRGDCEFDGLQLLECASAPNGEGILDLDLFGLTPGITYFIRINDWSASASPNDGAFKLCVIKKPPVNTVDQGGSTACSGTLSDSGGPDEDYGNNENFVYTICPAQPHNCINFSLEYYNVENFGDQIIFYDGPGITSPQIGSISGGGNGANFGGVCYSVAAQSGCLTIQFISNGATVFEGFQGFWECTSEECQQLDEITVQTGSSPADIVQSVVSGQTSITITNIDCDNTALGTFEAGPNTDLGLEKGILLTSGSAAQAANPGAFFSSTALNAPGDPDLDYLSQINGNNSPSTDACIVEMDVFASTDEITFEYIFGSEEYPNFVNSSFNDIFAFLVSGPGIVGDPNIANQQNIATLPDGTFIQINSVNFINNWEYFRDNQDGQSVAYGGLTSDSLGVKKSLTARVQTIPCNTYHLKLAIADRQDFSYDSGVFISEIKGGSPNLGVNYNSGIQYLVEECVNIPDEVVISLNTLIDQPATYDIVLGGTATLGVDYMLTLPGSVTFNNGSEVFTFPIQALSDGLVEGTETIIIQLVRDFGCGATVLATLEIELHDNLQVQIFEDQLDTALVCAGNGAQMTATGAETYFWQPPGIFSDASISNPTANPDSSMWVTVTGTLGLCTDVDSIYLNLIDPEVNIIPEGDVLTICATDSIVLTAVNNVNNSNLQWSSFFIPIPDPSNPVQTIYPPPFFPFVPLTVQVELGGCIATDNVQVEIDAFNFPVVANDTTVCQNYSVDLGTDIVGTTTNFTWTPNVGLNPGNDVSGPIATPDVTTTYTLIAESATGVCKDTAEVTITVIPIDVEIQNPDTVFICVGESVTLTNTNTTAGAGVTWTPNFFMTQVSPQEVVVNPPVSTWYYTTLVGPTCTVTDSVLVYVDSIPDLSIVAMPAKETYCLGEKILLTSPTYEPGNFPGLQLMWDDEIPGALTPDSFLNLVFIAVETHTYIRTTTVNACTSVDSIEIIVTPAIVIEVVPPLDTICPGEAVNLTINGPDDLEEFSWSPPNGLSCADCRNPVATPGATTTYNVQAEYQGCPVGASTTLIVPSGPVFNLADTLICPNNAVLLNSIVNPNAVYSWTSSDGSLTSNEPTPTVNPSQTTTYTVTATIGDCVSTDSVTVTVAQDFTLEIDGPAFVCLGDEATYTAVTNPEVPGLIYKWTKSDGANIGSTAQITRVPTEPVTYTVMVSDAMGCFPKTDSIEVSVSSAILLDSIKAQEVQIDNDTIFEGEEFVLFVEVLAGLPAGATFNWYVDDVLVSTTNDTISEVLNAIEIFGEDLPSFEDLPIRVEIVTAEGCTIVKASTMRVHNIPIGIPNGFSPNGDGTNDSFKIISLIPLTINEFKVWNRWGQLVYDNESGVDGWDGKQKNEDAPSDVYIYRVVYEVTGGSGKEYTKKGDVTLLR